MGEIFTAGDIARHIKRPREPMSAAVARFKNWAKMGLIKQVGARHPGTGRKKRYSEKALVKAVLLQVLTDALGAPAARLSDMADHTIETQGMRSATGPGDSVMVISKPLGGQHRFHFGYMPPTEIADYIKDPEFAVHIVIDIKRLLERLGIEKILDELED